jgi:hypothetical protein
MSHAAEHVESESESIIEIIWMKIIIVGGKRHLQ